MSYRIFKYELSVGPIGYFDFNHASKIIHVAEQLNGADAVKFWVEWHGSREPGEPERKFVLLATGAHTFDCYEHRGTAICAGGALVWHLYEIHD